MRLVYQTHLQPFLERYALGPSAHSLHPKSVFIEMMYARHCNDWEIERKEKSAGESECTGKSMARHRCDGC
jgi:hypothetical protein